MQTVSRLISSFTPQHYNLSLNLERSDRTFFGTVTINGSSTKDSSFRLHSKELTIESVTVDGRSASWSEHENDELEISQQDMRSGDHIVVIAFSGKITDQMHGLYPCYYNHDGQKKELLATQFESHHAREVFPCVDEPEAKATFDVTLTTENDITVLGNMPIKTQAVEDDKLVTSFETSPRMSSYLLAWVTGELQKKTARTKRGVEVNVWSTPAHSLASLDFALDFATRTIDYFEEYFGIDYPLPKSDHVTLPDFTSGAMENWGLITYREIALLADPETSTIDAKHYVAMVVAHELSHQWFGNLVTMKWWDNLWLNESFANFIENLPIHAMHPEWGVWMDYASTWSLMALRRDAIDGVQPVQTEVNHPDEISSLFDGAIVYGKGGRLIGMLREYVGEENFRKGLKAYFTKFQYQNTTGEDLWDCLEEASGKPVRDFMNQWVLRSGYPIVSVDSDKITQEQFFIGDHEASDKLWPIPLSADPKGALPDVLDTREFVTQVDSDVRLNVGNWSHFVTRYSDQHFDMLLKNLKSYPPMDRLQLLNERTLLARAGAVSSASLIPMLQASKDETHESVWGILSLALGELRKFVEFDDEGRSKLKRLTADLTRAQFERLGWNHDSEEVENDTKLRPIILAHRLYSEDSDVVTECVKRYDEVSTPDELDPELRAVILAGKVKSGLSESEFESLLNYYVTSSSSGVREDIIGALTDTDNEYYIERLLKAISNSEIVRPQDASHWYVYLVRSRFAKTASWQWLRDNWSWVEKSFGGDKSYDDFPRYTAGALTTREQLEEYKEFFSPMVAQPALKRVIQLGTSEIKARVDLIEKDTASVKNALTEL